MEIVLNKCFGGFSLSEEAWKRLGIDDSNVYNEEEFRSSSRLIECVRALGDSANGNYAELEIVEIPSDVTDWKINDYDGMESITYVLNSKLHHA